MSPLLILFPWGTLFKSCHLSFTEKVLFWIQGELYLINELWIYLPFLAFVLHSVASLLNWMLFELFHCLVITTLPLTHSSFIKNGGGLHTVNQKKESKRGKWKHQPKTRSENELWKHDVHVSWRRTHCKVLTWANTLLANGMNGG